jgi:1-acyl-sn-glycerol-3-phosphate acyltransferase
LLVANHPNSLLDPMLVCAAARRPVRFLAKAPLFDDWKLGWLMRGVGAVPVYRRHEAPDRMHQNVDAFQAVRDALAGGSAVGIFPEGVSHSEPSLATLKTGAARIALGTGAAVGGPFPLIPIGLEFRDKDIFRSSAVVLVGEAVSWDDLSGRGEEDREAVLELTARIEAALRRVTVNLERWSDKPLIDCAQRIWEAERGADREAGARVSRLALGAQVLSKLRQSPAKQWRELPRAVRAHCRRLARLRLTPAAILAPVDFKAGLRWATARFPLVFPLAAAMALSGLVAFYPPYRTTGVIVDRLRLERDQRSTWKLLLGIVIYASWIGLITGLAYAGWGWAGALIALVGLPLVGLTGLLVRERWRGAWSDARRYALLRSRRTLIADLRDEQRRLADELDALYRDLASKGEI